MAIQTTSGDRIGNRSARRRATTAIVSTVLLCTELHTIAMAPPAAAATTIHVPADQPSITAALSAAANGDTIEVAPGTYVENIDFNGKDVNLVSAAGPGATTLDPAGSTHIEVGPGGLIEGFTITGGHANLGGAMQVAGVGTVIRANRFVNNDGSYGYGGAAVYGNSASPTIDRNVFSGNACEGDEQHLAGVLTFVNSSSPIVTNNVFVDNPCGAAVNLTLPMGNTPRVIGNTILGGPKGIHVDGRVDTVQQVIRNNIIVGNGIGFALEFGPGLPTFDHNLVAENGADYTGTPSQTGVNGNIGGDPQFINRAARDFRLAATSPAVDTGSVVGAPSVDHNGSARPLDGPDPDGDAEFDIGAFERDGSEPPPVPQTGILDRGWSGDGLQNQSSRYAIALGPTSDGGTYTGVYKATDGNGPMRISKYTPTGAPGPGWGSTGYVIRAFEPGGTGTSVPTNVVPSGTKVTVVGEHYRSAARLGVARLLGNGSYDTTFSSDGRALYKVFPTEHDVVSAFRADVLTGGKIGIAAAAFDFDSRGNLAFTAQAMLRLNANGTVDTTFSGDGVAVIPLNWSDIRWRPNGSSFVGVQGSSTHQVRKLLSNGQLDATFSGDGIASAACGTHRGANMEVDSSNRPLLMCVKSTGTSVTLAMYRFTTTGAFDTTYSGDGKTLWVIPDSNQPTDDAMYGFDALAKPWAIAGGPGATTTLRVYTLSSSGNPDTGFSGNGASSISLPFNVDGNTFGRVASNRLFIANYNGDVNVSLIAIKV